MLIFLLESAHRCANSILPFVGKSYGYSRSPCHSIVTCVRSSGTRHAAMNLRTIIAQFFAVSHSMYAHNLIINKYAVCHLMTGIFSRTRWKSALQPQEVTIIMGERSSYARSLSSTTTTHRQMLPRNKSYHNLIAGAFVKPSY